MVFVQYIPMTGKTEKNENQNKNEETLEKEFLDLLARLPPHKRKELL